MAAFVVAEIHHKINRRAELTANIQWSMIEGEVVAGRRDREETRPERD